jgi:hypothetical protein
MPTPKLTAEIIAAAIEGFESQKRRLDDRIAELRSMLPGGSAERTAAPESPVHKRRRFSAAARKRMREAQQRRWARIRGEPELPAPATEKPAKPKRRISEEGMKRIIAATKKRWALKRAEAKKAESARKRPAAKKTAVKSTRPTARKKATAAKTTAPAPTPAAT